MSYLLSLLFLLTAAESPGVELPLDKAVVHRPPYVTHREAFEKLPEAAVMVQTAPAAPLDLAQCFIEAAARKDAFRGPSPAILLATGPMLDGPDKVLPRRLVREGDHITLEVAHTAVRTTGARLMRNIIWRPMVRVPLELPVGRYEIKVIWQPVSAIPDGKNLESPALTRSTKLEIVSAK
jgi:hypothetical protein